MPAKRAWRKLVKKQQRHRRRQKVAREREKAAEAEQKTREADPEYLAWLKKQTELDEFQRQASERLQQEEEEAWLRREAIAQRQFKIDAAKRAQQESECERLRAQQAQELAAQQEELRKRREEKKRREEEAAAEFEAMMQRMHEYMEDKGDRSPPVELRRVVETNPSERLCEFFTRTNCCRFGHSCTFNHKRPMLAKILLIRHFFTHPLLQADEAHKEYSSADEHLELTQEDLRADYDEFFKDVIDELEKFGKIVNFRAVRNTLPHLRGHVFVEYAKERFALRAFINLQGRYYASRRLNVEFSNLKTWRGAVCGLSLARKCPKGYSCAYLHLFRNPNNLFNSQLEHCDTPKGGPSLNRTPQPKLISWNDNEKESRSWRWSESPEVELNGDNSSSRSRSRHQSRERDESSRTGHKASSSSVREKNSRSQRTDSSRSERERSSRSERAKSSSVMQDKSSRSAREETSKSGRNKTSRRERENSSSAERNSSSKSYPSTSIKSDQSSSFRSDHDTTSSLHCDRKPSGQQQGHSSRGSGRNRSRSRNRSRGRTNSRSSRSSRRDSSHSRTPPRKRVK